MNKGSFAFSMLSACDSDLLLLVTVFSLPWRIGQRISIRETWGKSVGKDVKVVFIIGNVDSINVRMVLEEENKRYKDLVQGKFLDASLYNTYKYITAFKYAIYHCPRAKYILKVKDDVFVNINAMLDFIYEQLSPYGAKKLLMCPPLEKTEKQRLRIKWIAPFPEHNDAYNPPYCQEWSSLYSPDVIFTLYEELQKMRHFWVDELLTTGVLAKNANIPCISTRSLTLYSYSVDKILGEGKWDNTNKAFLYAEPSISAKEMHLLWRIFKDPLKSYKFTTRASGAVLKYNR